MKAGIKTREREGKSQLAVCVPTLTVAARAPHAVDSRAPLGLQIPTHELLTSLRHTRHSVTGGAEDRVSH